MLYSCSAGDNITSGAKYSHSQAKSVKLDLINDIMFGLDQTTGLWSYIVDNTNVSATSADNLDVGGTANYIDIEPSNRFGVVSKSNGDILSFTYDTSGNITSADKFSGGGVCYQTVIDKTLKNVVYSGHWTNGFWGLTITTSGIMTSAEHNTDQNGITGLTLEETNKILGTFDSTDGTRTYIYTSAATSTSADKNYFAGGASRGKFLSNNVYMILADTLGLISNTFKSDGIIASASSSAIGIYDNAQNIDFNISDDYFLVAANQDGLYAFNYETSGDVYCDLASSIRGSGTSANPLNFNNFLKLFLDTSDRRHIFDGDTVRVKNEKMITSAGNVNVNVVNKNDNIKITSWEDKLPWKLYHFSADAGYNINFISRVSNTTYTLEDMLTEKSLINVCDVSITNCKANINNCIFFDKLNIAISQNSVFNFNGCSFNNGVSTLTSALPA
jgi:hypothetical protein